MPWPGAIPALSDSSLPFAEELHPPGVQTETPGPVGTILYPRSCCGFDTWFCRCDNDARAVGLSLALPLQFNTSNVALGPSPSELANLLCCSQPASSATLVQALESSAPGFVVRSNTGLLLGGVRDDWLALQTATGQPRARDLDPAPARRWCRGPIPPRCYQNATDPPPSSPPPLALGLQVCD